MSTIDERIEYYRAFSLDDLEGRLASGALGSNSQILCKSLINEKCGIRKYDVPTVDEIRTTSIASSVVEQIESPQLSKKTDQELVGIDGWLILPALSLLSGIIFPIIGVVGLLSPSSAFSTWAQASSGIIPLTKAFSEAGLTSINVIVIVLFLFQYFLSIYAAALFFRKQRKTPTVIITLIAVGLLVSGTVVTILMTYERVLPFSAPEMAPYVFGLIGGLISAAIWIPYFRLSKRVKATFVR